VPPGATIIKAENFEGDFPNGLWYAYDQSNDGYERYWDDANCDQCGGDWAAWPADGGANRRNVCNGANYPNNMEAWMVYGPFDLSDASNAGTEFVMWHEIEAGYDWVFFGISLNCIDYYGLFWDGNAGCTLHNILYPDFVGDPSVCAAWVFGSDSGLTYEGPWVDDIVIWKDSDCSTVKVNPPYKIADKGYPFTVDIAVEDARDLGAFEFELTYNSACVNATGVTAGPFLGSTGRSVAEVGPSFGTGSVTYGAYSWGSGAGPSGNGVLATVTFQAGANECVSDLTFQNVSLADTSGNEQCAISVDGTVQVSDACPSHDCPEDLNCDGVINVQDIMLVAGKWGQACPTR
jgi:hypothetical protein